MNFIRCFISADLPEGARDSLARVQSEFGKILGVNFVPKQNLHVTLAFLGEVSEPELKGILAKAADVAGSYGPFGCSFANLEAIPQRMPRLLWVSVNCGSMLSEVHSALKASIGFEDKKFTAHITLARIKSSKAAMEISRKARELHLAPMGFMIERISVMESRLTPAGAVYSAVKILKLGE